MTQILTEMMQLAILTLIPTVVMAMGVAAVMVAMEEATEDNGKRIR